MKSKETKRIEAIKRIQHNLEDYVANLECWKKTLSSIKKEKLPFKSFDKEIKSESQRKREIKLTSEIIYFISDKIKKAEKTIINTEKKN